MLDTIFGLPVHALVIHAVVVLIPLCALGVVVMAVWAVWRERLRLPVWLLLVVGGFSTLLAKQSGEKLQARVSTPGNPVQRQLINHHVSIGTQAVVVVFVFCVAVTVWLYLDWRPPAGMSATVTKVMSVVAVVAAVAATGWVVWAGHAGSTAVWQQTIVATNPK